MSDATIARVGRTLGVALIRYARERQPEQMKEIQLLHTELCAALRHEEAERAEAEAKQENPS